MATILALSFPASAYADGDKPTTDKSIYSLLNPTPDKDLRDFNPDRPGKITSPFTIDAGRLDIESDFVNFQSSDAQGKEIHSFEVTDPTIKLGLLSNVDVEMTLNGGEFVRVVSDTSPRTGRTYSGFGDVYVRC